MGVMLESLKQVNEKIKGIITQIDAVQNELSILKTPNRNENELAQILVRRVSAAGVELIVANDIIYEAEECIDEIELQNFINEYSGDAA